MLTMLLFISLLVASVVPGNEAWSCGPSLSCECYENAWTICDYVTSTPHFKLSVTRRRYLMMTVKEDDFATSSLVLTHGYMHVTLAVEGANDDYCENVMQEYPWIHCYLKESTSTEKACLACYSHARSTAEKSTSPESFGPSPQPSPRPSRGAGTPTGAGTTNVFVSQSQSTDFNTQDSVTGGERPSFSRPETWKDSPIVFWLCVAGGIFVAGVVMVTALIIIIKKKLCNNCLAKCRDRRHPRYGQRFPVRVLQEEESIELYSADKADKDV